MATSYSHRSVLVLSLLGILSAFVSVLSVLLLFQLHSQQQRTGRESPPRDAAPLPGGLWDVLPPVCTVLSALSLTLSLGSVSVCLLHSYCATEVCRGEHDTERADWFLLESRGVRHLAIGLFCVGVSVFLAAMSIYMLLIFQLQTGIASACILCSGVLILLIVVIHSLVKSSQTSGLDRHPPALHPHTLFHNMHGGIGGPPLPGELKAGADRPHAHAVPSPLHWQTSCPPPKQPDPLPDPRYSPARGSQQGYPGDKDGYSSGGSSSRMHRTLSTELLQSPTKPWNGVNNEMRSVLARKSGVSGKDSTLV